MSNANIIYNLETATEYKLIENTIDLKLGRYFLKKCVQISKKMQNLSETLARNPATLLKMKSFTSIFKDSTFL